MNNFSILELIRKNKPLINVISNDVTKNFIADSLLAIGCSPIMATAVEELEDIIKNCNALVINTGTPDKTRIETYIKALSIAKEYAIPTVLDFPGAASSRFRTDIADQLFSILSMDTRSQTNWPVCIRGNASEIIHLGLFAAGLSTDRSVKNDKHIGIDSRDPAESAFLQAGELLDFSSVVHISGAENIVCTREFSLKAHNSSTLRAERIPGGHHFMRLSSGFGCVNSAINAAFLSTLHIQADDTRTIKQHNIANQAFSLTGDAQRFLYSAGRSACNYNGPASYKTAFIDSLFNTSRIETKQIKGELYAHS